jgi:hypothetical protein
MWKCSLQCGWGSNPDFIDWIASNAVEERLEAIRKLQELGIKEGYFTCYYADKTEKIIHQINFWQGTIRATDTTDIKHIAKVRARELAALLRVNYLKHSRAYQAAIRQGNLWTMGGKRFRFSVDVLAHMRLFTDALLRGWRDTLLEFLRSHLGDFLERSVKLLPRPPLKTIPQIQPNAPALSA